MTNKSIAGAYYLEGVRETGSGIKLNEDGSFYFFFSYGALDKQGSGNYTITDSKVILNSRPRPLSDFVLTTSKHTAKKNLQIKITDKNPIFLDRVVCKAVSGKESETVETNSEGEITFTLKSADTIYIYHPIFSDRLSPFIPPVNGDNYFEFKIDPAIMEIFCNNLILNFEDGKLTGPHPLLNPQEVYNYVKAY